MSKIPLTREGEKKLRDELDQLKSQRPKIIQTIAEANLICGIKPIPEIGCNIGQCVDGFWEQVCDQVCGIKPIPKIGCNIGRCVNGEWEQVCDQW